MLSALRFRGVVSAGDNTPAAGATVVVAIITKSENCWRT